MSVLATVRRPVALARPTRVYETVLYAPDLPAMAAFYSDVLGLVRVSEGPPYAAFRLGDGGVLLLFDPRQAAAPGRIVPSHGTSGPGHVAFSVGEGCLERWRDALPAGGVPIEAELEWPAGGRSLYVRDPAGNSVELVEGEIWP
jgi:catechol 2,3-dioxygenase-like lactoylglutathione lyase family enzyme